MKMRIAVFVEYLPPRLGSDRRIFEIMKRLVHKHEIHFVVFPPFRELLKKSSQSNANVGRNSRTETKTINIESIHGHFISIPSIIAPIWRRSLIIAYCLTSALVFLKSARVMRKINPDIVVLNYPSPYTGLLGFLEGKLWNKPIVLDFNDLIAQYTINLLSIKKASFKAKILVFVQQYLVKNSQKTITPTHFIKRYTVSLGLPKNKITVISNGVDTRAFHPTRFDPARLKLKLSPNKEKLCVYSGRLDEWAGINLISKLSDIAETKKLNAKFVLAGSGAEKMLDKENVILLGAVPYEEIPHLLTTADVILIPFPNNEVSHAASPLKLFEGMAMGKPIIASKVSGIAEAISDGENGFLADPENVNEWVEKLETILTYENIAKKVGQNARRTVEEKFEWNCLAKQYEEILNSVSRIQVIKSHVD